MKRGLAILIAGLILGVAAYGCAYFVCTGSARKLQQSERPEMAWLKEEFHLNGAEFQRISELHRAYLPQCAEMCRRIAAENEELQRLLGSQTNVTPQMEQALAETARLRAECQTKMLKHFFEVSHTMPPEEGKRYFQWVREKAFASERDMATAHTDGLRDSAPEHISTNH